MATFTLSNIPTPLTLAPSGFPTLAAWQMTFDLQALPSFNTPEGESSLANQFGTWFALSYLQSPQQTTQLLWTEIGLMQQFLLERGSNFLLERNERALDLSMSLVVNPLYNTSVGYGTALLESELILVSVL
jgi:hypothetical protein